MYKINKTLMMSAHDKRMQEWKAQARADRAGAKRSKIDVVTYFTPSLVATLRHGE